ncbi:BTB/POZ domain-containing protein 18 [Pyxicephalus adspersus]|uniref:BTB/POZ domain-containing protein 18 n=1 Tax=Pyxicephalus adspersus TaxID=30357 RepID=UPI003B5BFE53
MATGRHLSYCNPRLLRTVFLQLHEQQEKGVFCDVTLQGDDDGLHVHACVVAACSPYLAKLLNCPAEGSNTKASSGGSGFLDRRILNVSGIPKHYLLPLVSYMYTSELVVPPADAYGVLKAAQKLKIPVLDELRLEGGRIVRPETGRRLNRGCLQSRKQTYDVVNDLQDSGTELMKDEVHAHEESKPFEPGSVNNDLCSPHKPDNIFCTQNLDETIPNNQNLLETVENENMHIKPVVKRLYKSPEGLSNQNSLGTMSEQNQSCPESLVDQVKDEEEKQEIHDTPGNAVMKRRKLNRGAKVGVSPVIEMSTSPRGKLSENMTDIAKTEKTGECTSGGLAGLIMVEDVSSGSQLTNVQSDVFQIRSEDLNPTEHLIRELEELYTKSPKWEGAGDSEALLACIGIDNKVVANKDKYFGIADPSVSCSSLCTGLEVLNKVESDPTEVQKDTVPKKDPMLDCLNDFEANMTSPHSSTADKLGGIYTCTKVHLVHEVEKVKLRKIKNGLSWEIVKDMNPDIISDNENAEQVNDLEELLEQGLNIPSSSSDVDVGGCSPLVWTGEILWPDPSSESDEEIDVGM